jgi:hypothetical protein
LDKTDILGILKPIPEKTQIQVFRTIFDSGRKTVFKGMGFLTNRTVEYREKDQTYMKMPRYTQHQAHLVCLYGCRF